MNTKEPSERQKKNGYIAQQLAALDSEQRRDKRLTRAQQNRQIRQDEMRRAIAEKARADHILIGVYRLENEANEMTAQEISALGKALDIRMKLLNKYLPDLKSIEVTKEETHETLTIDVHEYRRIREDMLKDDDC